MGGVEGPEWEAACWAGSSRLCLYPTSSRLSGWLQWASVLQALASKSPHPLPQGFLQSLGSLLGSNSGMFPKWEIGLPWEALTSAVRWRQHYNLSIPGTIWRRNQQGFSREPQRDGATAAHGKKCRPEPALVRPATSCPRPHASISGPDAELSSQARPQACSGWL